MVGMKITESNFTEVTDTLIRGQQSLLRVELKSDLRQIRTEHRVNLAINTLLDALKEQGYSLYALVEPVLIKYGCHLKGEIDTELKHKLDKKFYLDFYEHETIYKYLQHRLSREGL